MQGQLGSRMRRHGYLPDPVPMSPLDRVRYAAIRWPAQAARMVAWDAIERAQHRLPGVVGRRPSAAMTVDRTQHLDGAGGQP